VHEPHVADEISEELIQEIKKVPYAISLDQLTVLKDTEKPLEY
jgi:hypothetical protein